MKNNILKVTTIFAILAMSLFMIVGETTSINYWFPSHRTAFQNVQDRGYVNIINKIQKNNDIELTVQAIVTDQLTTYVRIRADGINRRELNFRGDRSVRSIAHEIKEAVLSDEEGNIWKYKVQFVDKFEDVEISDGSPIMSSEKLKDNEAILIFYGGPESDTKFSLEITFFQESAPFIFNNMEIKVPPIVRRNLDGVAFKTDFASGTIQEIVYTALETRLIIDWKVYNNHPEKYSVYNRDNRGLYRNGEIEFEYSLPFPRFSRENETVEFTGTFVIHHVFNPESDLIIDIYQDYYSKNCGQLVSIPSEN